MLVAPAWAVATLGSGWELAEPRTICPLPSDLPAGVVWRSVPVPGTVASALSMHGLYDAERPEVLHQREFWYRIRIDLSGGRMMRLHGLAGVADVYLGDELLLSSRTMFVTHEIAVTLEPGMMLYLRFRPLASELARTSSPRPRWRTRLTSQQGLRSVRQTMLGHMPGWCPPIDAIGPYRAIELVDLGGPVWRVELGTELRGDVGTACIALEALGRGCGEGLRFEVAGRSVPIDDAGASRRSARIELAGIAPWWPHTHGTPALHAAGLRTSGEVLALGRVGFRRVTVDRDDDGEGFGVRINDVAVFCRGACWTNASPLDLAHGSGAYGTTLEAARDAGMNMVRVGGTMLYESDAFHATCDALGLMVWQDLMFASLDPVVEEEGSRDAILAETDQLCARLARHASSTVLCGGSEMAQQGAMFGLPEADRRLEFFETTLADRIADARIGAAYVANTPLGGDPPFRVDRGIAHYYSVGAYRRPLVEQRRDRVRFAAECLAFANPPDEPSRRAQLSGIPPQDPRWKALVPRDPGAAWDFEDVRDHYLAELYHVDPAAMRRVDPERYLDQSRGVIADLMERVISEWRQPGSSCRGALVWQLQDLRPGSGWGVIGSDGRPKSAWHGMRRVLASRQVLISDEGPNGLAVHALNETADAIDVRIELSCLRQGRDTVMSGMRDVALAPRSAVTLSASELFGRFFDANLAFGFGPPSHDVAVATMHAADGSGILSDACWFADAPIAASHEPGLTAALMARDADAGSWVLALRTERLARSVHVDVDGFLPDRDWFHLPPGRRVELHLRRAGPGTHPPRGEVAALNALVPVGFG